MSNKVEREMLLKATESFDTMKEDIDTSISDKKPKLENNQIEVDGIGIITIKATKIKYFKSGDYNNFMVIKTLGISEMLRYEDGDSILNKYLTAVFDKEPTQDFIDNLTTQNLLDIITIANNMNGIKDEDFLEKMKRMEAKKDSV